MNVLFHVATGLGTVILLTDTHTIKSNAPLKSILPIAALALCIGVIAHGALDYIPHCYPVNTKIDMSLGLLLILGLLALSKSKYKWIMLGGLTGCVLPDIIDLLPTMLNKNLGLNLPIIDKVFPWHWKQYSGSIYSGNCGVSAINHCLVVITVGLFLWFRKRDVKNILGSL